MKSPFPGMDPYLERYWLSVHNKLITYMSDELNAQLPGDLRAEMTERVLVSSTEDSSRRRILPDVYIARNRRAPAEAATSGTGIAPSGGVAVAEPVVFRFADDRAIETAIR